MTADGPLILRAPVDDAFMARLDDFIAAKRDHAEDVTTAALAIVRDVQARGDEAVAEYTKRFDGFDPMEIGFQVGRDEIDAAETACPEDVRDALTLAASRIRAYHERQRPEAVSYTDDAGVTLGYRWSPVRAAGLYVPGGKAVYPSSVLMNAIPAKAAGVERVVMTVPTPEGQINPVVLAAARIAGVDTIYRVGGAQAVAALAFGTTSIARVDRIAGPGNAYVNAAKRLVYGQVGIDLLAGPSEILVIADKDNDPAWIAMDLLSQAEHDEAARAVLITDDETFAQAVVAAVDRHLETLERREIAGASWRTHGGVIVVDRLDQAPDIVNRLAPEHLEIATADPEALLGDITEAGAIFLGNHTPEAVGDYVAGTNHVLPTGGAARFASGLSVLDFMKRTSVVRCSPEGLRAIGPAGITLARAEGLEAHAQSIAQRLT